MGVTSATHAMQGADPLAGVGAAPAGQHAGSFTLKARRHFDAPSLV
jgi:hypothetical protein